MNVEGYVDLSGWHAIRAEGADARTWLGDLLTADIAGLAPGRSTTSMLLSPTGRIRAVVCVGALDDGFILVQDPEQPNAIDALLAPYVLSSNVSLESVGADRSLLALTSPPPDDAIRWRPSCVLGDAGTDALVPRDGVDQAITGLAPIPAGDLARARLEAGVARFPGDLTEDSLPHETLHAHAVDETKGCYLGQEAVAKVRNLGHPPRILLRVRADAGALPGDEVLTDDGPAGVITTAAGELAIARVRWSARDRPLRTASGAHLQSLGAAYVRA